MGTVTQAVAQRDEQTTNTGPATMTPRAAVFDILARNKQALALSLPRGFDADRFSRLLITAANTNPDLFECDRTSFLAAGVAAAQLGLEPNDARGLAYLIPFKERKKDKDGRWTERKKVQLILGYRGMIDLARRSGMVTSINAFPVYTGDRFDYRLGLEPTLEHQPGDHDERPEDLTHVYAVAKVGGDPQFVVLTRRQIDKVMASSQGAKSDRSPWHTHYVEMALKTGIRRLCKFLPQTVEVARALDIEHRPLTIDDVGGISAEPADHDALEAGGVDMETGEIIDADSIESSDPQPAA